jgi:hypothetical protein
MRIRVTESLVSRADGIAWTFRLRGYDAVHLASALEWHDRIGEEITLATFDQDLWRAAGEAGLNRFPDARWDVADLDKELTLMHAPAQTLITLLKIWG